MNTDQRQYPRSNSGAMVVMSHPSLGMIEAKASGLSEGGVFVYAGNHLMPPAGTVMQVKIKRHTGTINDEPVPMRVVHVQPEGVGLAFV